jgi:hypothetical protein
MSHAVSTYDSKADARLRVGYQPERPVPAVSVNIENVPDVAAGAWSFVPRESLALATLTFENPSLAINAIPLQAFVVVARPLDRLASPIVPPRAVPPGSARPVWKIHRVEN